MNKLRISGRDSDFPLYGSPSVPIPLEMLGPCDPLTEPNLTEVRTWAARAYGWPGLAPHQVVREPLPVEVIEVPEEEWEEEMAEAERQEQFALEMMRKHPSLRELLPEDMRKRYGF